MGGNISLNKFQRKVWTSGRKCPTETKCIVTKGWEAVAYGHSL